MQVLISRIWSTVAVITIVFSFSTAAAAMVGPSLTRAASVVNARTTGTLLDSAFWPDVELPFQHRTTRANTMCNCKMIRVINRFTQMLLFTVTHAIVELALDQTNTPCLCRIDSVNVGGIHRHAVVEDQTGKQLGSP